jgi:hypothetical protein
MKITDTSIKSLFIVLLNIIEEQNIIIGDFKNENQQLKDEINRLKGEQGKPNINSKKSNTNISSEKERKKIKDGDEAKKNKKPPIIIDKETKCTIDKTKTHLPNDAYFLRYDELISQDIKLVRCNTKFLLEVYYSPSEQKTYRAEVPKEYTGYFSANTKSLIHILTHACDVTNSKLLQLLRTSGISISDGSLTNILLENTELFNNEKRDILKAGLSHSYCGLDSTRSKEKGKNLSTQIICNEYFTIFSSMPSKSRIDILTALQGEQKNGILYCYNETSRKLLDQFSVSSSDKNKLLELFNTTNNNPITKIELDKIIQEHIPELKAKKNMYVRVCESLAIGYYQEQCEYPPLKYLLSDDAPEYQKIAILKQALCWVHDGRAYKKLTPFIEIHRQICNDFMQEYWVFYRQLLSYKKSPCPHTKEELETKFDILFTTKTDYFVLNQRIEKTYSNKEKLLAVLSNPSLPLHNNESELGARRVVRKRDISLHTICTDGTKVKDAVMSIIETAKKLKVNFIDYLADRISGTFQMTPLAQLISISNTS